MDLNKNLKDKNAIVTGSTSGIGLGIAASLANRGCNVALNGFMDLAQAQALAADLAKSSGQRVQYFAGDISKYSEVEQMIKQIISVFGSVDILVNNAGIQHVAPIEEFPLDKWESVLATNLFGAFYTTKAVLALMKKQNFGRIINIASAHGLVASANKSAYVAAKHGIIGLSKTTALESAEFDVTCNAICPGWVATDLVLKQIKDKALAQNISLEQATSNLLKDKQPNNRFTSKEEIGDLVCFLSSASARSITGTSISIDGGWTAV
jgi:3-hydroxybutyrate dehydrogenase